MLRQKLQLLITKDSLVRPLLSRIANRIKRFQNLLGGLLGKDCLIRQIPTQHINRLNVSGIPIHPAVTMRLIAKIANASQQLALQRLGLASDWHQLLREPLQSLWPRFLVKDLFQSRSMRGSFRPIDIRPQFAV